MSVLSHTEAKNFADCRVTCPSYSWGDFPLRVASSSAAVKMRLLLGRAPQSELEPFSRFPSSFSPNLAFQMAAIERLDLSAFVRLFFCKRSLSTVILLVLTVARLREPFKGLRQSLKDSVNCCFQVRRYSLRIWKQSTQLRR